MTEQEKIAYDIGSSLAFQEYTEGMDKVAMMAALQAMKAGWSGAQGLGKLTGAARAGVPYLPSTIRGAGKALKWTSGFGGTAASRHLGMPLLFGGMGAYQAEDGLENKIRGFTGGAIGALAFSMGMGAAGKLSKGLLNAKAGTSATKWLGGGGRTGTENLARMKQHKDLIAKTQEKLTKSVQSGGTSTDKLQKALSRREGAYQDFLKKQNIGLGSRMMHAANIHKGTAVGVAAGLGAGMYASGLPEAYARKKQRIRGQANVFSPGSENRYV